MTVLEAAKAASTVGGFTALATAAAANRLWAANGVEATDTGLAIDVGATADVIVDVVVSVVEAAVVAVAGVLVVVVGAIEVVAEEVLVLLSGELTRLEWEFCFVNGDSLFIGEFDEAEDRFEFEG